MEGTSFASRLTAAFISIRFQDVRVNVKTATWCVHPPNACCSGSD